MIIRQCAFIVLVAMLLVTAACREDGGTEGTSPASNGQVVTADVTQPPPAIATNTPVPPTPTPTAPLAALVNGQPIYLADYERELDRYEAAMGDEMEEGYQDQVLDALIERELILQAATDAGVTVSPTTVDEQLAELAEQAAGAGGLDAWLQANLYTEEEFREALTAELISAEMIDLVTAEVPRAVEQVRARYIQMDDGDLAQSVLERARAGDDFGFLAQQNSVDRVTGDFGGDLGYFAPGSLLVPEVEAAAFALQAGEISDVVAVTREDGSTVYFIVQVTDRDPNRELTADALHASLQAAFLDWLEQLWAGAVIERFAPQGR
ncbi:MAG: SurA N-terminal domain-containing protein [Chloroflexota bacterium]|jgi:parvulin-like peptidyl-prolyl isomerase